MNSTILALASQVFDFAKAIAVASGVPFASVVGALGDLVIKEIGAAEMAQKIDGWKVAEAQAEALAITKLGPRPE